MMSKELFMAAHEQLIEEYLEAHPLADWSEAYERTADHAHDKMIDNIAAAADYERDRRKYER
jgi:hypothetical protein